MRDLEDMSRLLDGDLDPAAADALRARIAADPRLAAAWERMRALPAALADLPDEVPPPGLDDRVLGRVPARRRAPLWVAPVAVAAVALLVLGLRPEPGRVVIASGEQWVDGRVDVLAGDVPVSVDGLARVVVEPAAGVVRGGAGEEGTMKAVLAGGGGALAGAVVTVAVMRGEATLAPADGGPIVVEAGDSRTISNGPVVRRIERQEAPAGATPAERIAWLEAEVEDLRGQLAEAEFGKAVAQGQLLAEQGEALAWPDEYPDPMRPDAFEAVLRARAAEIPGLSVHEIDCSEYPCLATLRATDLSEGWQDRVHGLPVAISPEGQDETGVWMTMSASDDGENRSGIIGIALVPSEESGPRDDVNQRLDWRAKGLLQELAPAP